MRIHTLDGGEISAGYWGPDTSKVELGELPPMTTQQFAGYAALTLARNIIPDLDPDTRPKWTADARRLHDMVKDVPTMRITGQFIGQTLDDLSALGESVPSNDVAEHNALLNNMLVPIEDAVYYRENPFVAQAGGTRVDFVHESAAIHMIDREDFFSLAYRVIRGGLAGWQADGAEPGVVDAAKAINDAFERQ